jgi:hypothetical protein
LQQTAAKANNSKQQQAGLQTSPSACTAALQLLRKPRLHLGRPRLTLHSNWASLRFLLQLGCRLAHVLRRILPISLYLLQKDGRCLAGHDLFLKRVGKAYSKFIEEVSSTQPAGCCTVKSCVLFCSQQPRRQLRQKLRARPRAHCSKQAY